MIMDFPAKGYVDIFKSTPAALLIIGTDGPVYTILDANDAYLSATNSTRETLIGKGVFAMFPANPTDEVSKNIEYAIFSFEQAIHNKKVHTMSNYRYDIPIRDTGEFEERYWTVSNTPILDDNGNVKFLIHSPANVTEFYKANEREMAGIEALRNQRQELYSTFMQAPVGIAIFMGPEYIVDLINPPLCELYGKTMAEMLGKPVFDVLTHTKGMGFEELLDNVRITGTPFKGQGLATPIFRNGKLETVFLNFVYEPFRENDGSISGVIVVATEITEQVNAKQQIEEAEERARLAVDAVGLGTFDLNLSTGEMITSKLFANIFGFDEPVPRTEYLKKFHPDDLELRRRAHEEAVLSGKLFYEVRLTCPAKNVHWIRLEGKVYYDSSSTPVRILGTLLDITEQVKAMEEQQKLITLVANSVDLMSISDRQGANSYMNLAGRNLLGFKNEEQVLTTPISELHVPDDYCLVYERSLTQRGQQRELGGNN